MSRLCVIALLILINHSAHGSDPAESIVVQIIGKIETGQLSQAKSMAFKLTQRFPEFNLGHLLYADTLKLDMGESPIETRLQGKTEYTLENLRQEATLRWQHNLYPPPKDSYPSSIGKLSPKQPYAFIADLTKSRLYVFKNMAGKPKLIDSHYIGIGKSGKAKQKEGDNKTPLGTYRILQIIPDQELPDLYGSGAYTLNYPNSWDKLNKRTGHGIWLHGVPHNLYNRPPLSSEGCITLNNKSFTSLKPYIQTGITPVLNVDKIDWLNTDQWEQRQQALLQTIQQWETDWENKDLAKYLAHYSADFKNSTQKDYTAWSQYKKQTNQYKSYIDVNLSDMSIFEYSGEDGPVIQVNFTQDYRSNNVNSERRKSQLWKKEEGKWKIIYEGRII